MGRYNKLKLIVSCMVLAVGALFLMPSESHAMPNFARKYGADCSLCHTVVPRLNRFGYEFRAAGYRDPGEIGEQDTEDFKLSNYFAGRIQEQYQYNNHNAASSGTDTTSSQLTFKEFTMYPLTGSWGKYFGSLSEISMAPDESPEIENAYFRMVYPLGENWIQGRVGIMHSFEGFGASDRPIGNNRTLFQTTTATGSPFKIWSKDESGVEVGFYSPKMGTTISANVWNGINSAGDAASGGSLTKDSTEPAYNDKDFQVFVNQFITDNAALSFYYYYGVVPFPATGTQTKDKYQRFAFYGNFYPIKEKLNLIGGYEFGKDSLNNSTVVTGGSNVGDNNGFFAGAEYFVSEKNAFAVRYDNFDPSDEVGHNTVNAINLSYNISATHGLQFITDYQHKETDLTAGGTNKDDTVLARVIFIW